MRHALSYTLLCCAGLISEEDLRLHSLDAGFGSGGHGNAGTKQLRSIVLSLMLNLRHFYGVCLLICG